MSATLPPPPGKTLRDQLSARLQYAACTMLSGALIVAPWAYGSMRGWAVRALAVMLTVLMVCWLGSAWCGRRLRAVPARAGLPMVFLAMAGWMVVLTGPHQTSDPFNVRHFAELSGRWPGSFLVRAPTDVMWVSSGLFAAILLVMDAATVGLWRTRFYAVMAATGGSIVLLGVVQVLAGAQGVFWSAATPLAGSFFATFFEESVGVSFISLAWPIAAGGLMGRLGTPGAPTRRERTGMMLWTAAVVVGWLGLAVMGSLLGLIVGGVLVATLTVWVLWRLPLMGLRRYGVRCGWVAALCAVVSATGAIVSGKVPGFYSHWSRLQATLVADGAGPAQEREGVRPDFRMRPDGVILTEDQPSDANFSQTQRRKMQAVCWRMIPKAGLLGFGPGTWSLSYPHFTDDALLRTYYLQMQFAYNDFLQVLVEWGILGAVAWALLFYGGVSGGVYRLRRYRSKGGRIGEREGMIAGALAGLFGVLICAWWYFPLQVPAVQLYVAVLLGILWSAGERRGWSRDHTAQDVIPKPGAT